MKTYTNLTGFPDPALLSTPQRKRNKLRASLMLDRYYVGLVIYRSYVTEGTSDIMEILHNKLFPPPFRSPGLPLTSSTIGHKGIKDQSLLPPPPPHHKLTIHSRCHYSPSLSKNSSSHKEQQTSCIANRTALDCWVVGVHKYCWGTSTQHYRILRINQCLSIVNIFVKSIIVIKTI